MALVLREDFDAAQLRLYARQSNDADRVRRLLALAAIYDDASRAEAAEIGGVTRRIVRDWVERLNTGVLGALVARNAPGKSPLLTHDQRADLAQAAVEDGPTPAIDGVERLRLVDLAQWVWDRFAVSISRRTLGRELRAMRYRKLSVRPRHHAQAEGVVGAFEMVSPTL